MLTVFSCNKKKPTDIIIIWPDPKFAVDNYPSWSPDGKTIAFYRRPLDPSDTAGLYFINPDATNERLFLPGRGFVTPPTWSPDSKKLIYSYNYDLFKINVETKQITQLTFDGAWNLFPDWSKDGEWIAYDSELGTNGSSYIWVMDKDGKDKEDISTHGTGEWRSPSWSPDRELIVHTRSIQGPQPPEQEIFIMGENGDNPARLTYSQYGMTNRHPNWSPVGGKIIWASTGGPMGPNPLQIWIMDENGGNKRQLTTQGGDYPCFSPDGTKIVYVGGDERIDHPLLWIMDVDGRNKRQLTFEGW